jgi:hypothetical protein
MQGYTFQKLSHINPEDTFIQVFVEPLSSVLQTHFQIILIGTWIRLIQWLRQRSRETLSCHSTLDYNYSL